MALASANVITAPPDCCFVHSVSFSVDTSDPRVPGKTPDVPPVGSVDVLLLRMGPPLPVGSTALVRWLSPLYPGAPNEEKMDRGRFLFHRSRHHDSTKGRGGVNASSTDGICYPLLVMRLVRKPASRVPQR
jgi:hypothetical protein